MFCFIVNIVHMSCCTACGHHIVCCCFCSSIVFFILLCNPQFTCPMNISIFMWKTHKIHLQYKYYVLPSLRMRIEWSFKLNYLFNTQYCDIDMKSTLKFRVCIKLMKWIKIEPYKYHN